MRDVRDLQQSAVVGSDDRDFAHWRGCFAGGLYSAGEPQCTKSRLNRARSVQSCPSRKACVQSPTRTGPAVYKVGLCALEGLFCRGFVQCRRAPVCKVPLKQGPQCTKPALRWEDSSDVALRSVTRPRIMVPDGGFRPSFCRSLPTQCAAASQKRYPFRENPVGSVESPRG